jgi:hypothetical protein
MTTNVLVTFYSTYGHIHRMALAVAEGAESVPTSPCGCAGSRSSKRRARRHRKDDASKADDSHHVKIASQNLCWLAQNLRRAETCQPQGERWAELTLHQSAAFNPLR